MDKNLKRIGCNLRVDESSIDRKIWNYLSNPNNINPKSSIIKQALIDYIQKDEDQKRTNNIESGAVSTDEKETKGKPSKRAIKGFTPFTSEF